MTTLVQDGPDREIRVEDLLNDPVLLDRVIRESLSYNYAKRVRRIVGYISKVKGVEIYDKRNKLSGTITRHLEVMISNGSVEKTPNGYKLPGSYI